MSDNGNKDAAGLQRWLNALPVAAMFLTRFPVRAAAMPVSDAAVAFPAVGLVVGTLGGGAYWLAAMAGLPPLVSALVGLAVTVSITGALHEDGLADMADGLAGASPEDSIRIMRDSRTGGFGVLAMVFSVTLRAAALATIAEPLAVMLAMGATAALSRAAMPVVMHALPPASESGLAATAGRPATMDVLAGVGGAGLLLFFFLGPLALLGAGILAALAVWGMAALARRRLGGYTGDVLGAVQQATEIATLLALAATL
jgi:adenosylcobinamide-GDP ribazoletransferase